MHPFSGDRRAVIVTAIDSGLDMQFRPMSVCSDLMKVGVGIGIMHISCSRMSFDFYSVGP